MPERLTGGFEVDNVSYMTLGELANGTIDARDDQTERLEEFTNDVGSGNFHARTQEAIASACIDGRCGGTIRPNAAGGTNTLAVAYDLLNDINKGYLESYDDVVKALKEHEFPVGGHDDTNFDDNKSGCGACDKLAIIYDFMARYGDDLRTLEVKLGITVSNETNERMTTSAAARIDFPSGAKLKEKVETSGGTVDHLRGSHNEVIAIINMRPGTTLDRDAVEAKYGPNYEAFNIDAWAFEAAARAVARDDNQKVSDMVAAQVRYNLATAHVLCGPNMRVTVLR